MNSLSTVSYFYRLIVLLDFIRAGDDENEVLLRNSAPLVPKKAISTGGPWINVQTYFGEYCVDTFSAKDAEYLLSLDMKREQRWWKSFGERDTLMCSPYPNRVQNPTAYGGIDQHAFFQRRNIKIPVSIGVTEKCLHTLPGHEHDPGASKRFSRLLVECKCETFDAEDELCRDKKIFLSRGVGGDRSFFIHKLDAQGEYSVVAHICFQKSHLRSKTSLPWQIARWKSPEWYSLLFRPWTQVATLNAPNISTIRASTESVELSKNRKGTETTESI